MAKEKAPIGVDDISPGFSEDYQRYIELNPAYAVNPDTGRFQHPAAERDVMEVFFADENNEHARTNSAIARHIRVFHTYIKALIPQLDGNQLWRDFGDAGSQFPASPRTMGKTIQETSTHPTMRRALPREIGNEPDTIRQIPLHPRYFNDTRLRNLGLDQYIAPKGANMEARAALRAAATEDVRTMTLSLEPITRPDEEGPAEKLKYFRLMRIGAGPNRGQILGTQHILGKKIFFKTDLYNADLRLKEIDASHEREIGILKSIEELLRSIAANLDGWKNLPQDQREAIAEEIGQCIEMLEHVLDPDKIRMRELVESALTLKDRLGRYNPQAKKAQVETALKYLGKRLSSIEDIWKYLGTDTKKVAEIKQTNIAPLASFMREVSELHPQFAVLRPREPLPPERKEKIIANLRARRAEAQKMNFEPLLSFGEKFMTHIDATITALEAGDQPQAAREFMRMVVLTKIVRSMDRLKAVYERLALAPENIHPEDLKRELERQLSTLSTKAVGEDFLTDEYDAIYGKIYHLYNYAILMTKVLTGEAPPKPQSAPKGEVPSQDVPSKNTMSKMLESLKNIAPQLSHLFSRIEDKVRGYLSLPTRELKPKTVQPPRSPEPAFTEEDRILYYAKIQNRIKKFDYAALINSIN